MRWLIAHDTYPLLTLCYKLQQNFHYFANTGEKCKWWSIGNSMQAKWKDLERKWGGVQSIQAVSWCPTVHGGDWYYMWQVLKNLMCMSCLKLEKLPALIVIIQCNVKISFFREQQFCNIAIFEMIWTGNTNQTEPSAWDNSVHDAEYYNFYANDVSSMFKVQTVTNLC